jgi:hypothetical protein
VPKTAIAAPIELPRHTRDEDHSDVNFVTKRLHPALQQPGQFFIMAGKRIQITSVIQSNTEYSYERVHQHASGEITTVENATPHRSSFTVKVTTKPSTVERDVFTETTRTEGGSSSSVNIKKPGYDASQL